MLGVIVRVAAATAAVGFAAGVYAHRRAGKATQAVKEKFAKMETHLVEVQIPKGKKLEDCQLNILYPNDGDD